MSNTNTDKLWKQMYSNPFSISEEETEYLIEVNKKESRRWLVAGIVGVLLIGVTVGDGIPLLGVSLPRWVELLVNLSLALFLYLVMYRSYCTARVSDDLELLSEKGDHFCREALGLCAVSPEAETLRAALVASGSPLRVMHLKHLRKLSAKGACQQLHGIAA